MRKKTVFEYVFLGLFIMCMCFALCACLDYNTVAREREYLKQGIELLILTAGGLLLFFGIRLFNRIVPRFQAKTRTAVYYALLAVFFTAGLLLRLWVINTIPMEPHSDFETYYRMANELIKGTMLSLDAKVDRDYILLFPHTIGFPMLILYPVFLIFGVSVKNALLANLACSIVSMLLAARIARRLIGRLGAVITMALISLWPSIILFSTMIATEPAFTMLLLAATDLMVSILDRRKGSLYERNPGKQLALLPLLGIVLALSSTIRPMGLILLVAYGAVQLTVSGNEAGQVRMEGARFAMIRGGFCLVIVVVFYFLTSTIVTRVISDLTAGKPAGGLSASGYNMMVGLNYEHKGIWNQQDADFFDEAYERTQSANAAHAESMQVALDRIRTQPENVLDLMFYKYRDMWQTDDFGIDWVLAFTREQGTCTEQLAAILEGLRPCSRVIYMAMLLACLLGAADTWRKRTRVEPLRMIWILYFLGTALSHMLLETQVRYHYSMLPFLMLLAAWTIVSWRTKLALETPVRIVEVAVSSSAQEKTDDHTHFDMHKALEEGHIRMSVSKAYESLTIEHALESMKPMIEIPHEQPAQEPSAAPEAPDEPVPAAGTDEPIESTANAVPDEPAPAAESDEPPADAAPAVPPPAAESNHRSQPKTDPKPVKDKKSRKKK